MKSRNMSERLLVSTLAIMNLEIRKSIDQNTPYRRWTLAMYGYNFFDRSIERGLLNRFIDLFYDSSDFLDEMADEKANGPSTYLGLF